MALDGIQTEDFLSLSVGQELALPEDPVQNVIVYRV